jgi:two-component system phosphate regulon response regulator PhoB
LEEEPFVQDTLRLKLSSKGLKVITAYDEQEAKDIIREDSPDLILFDILHSRIDSYRFIQELKGDKVNQKIPVVILTFKEKDPEMEFTYNVWAHEYIAKPFSPREVADKVTGILAETED